MPLSALPPPPTDPSLDDRVPCPHCGRKFNATAAERHIPKCSSIRAKPKTLVRGGNGQGSGIANAMRAPSGARQQQQYVL